MPVRVSVCFAYQNDSTKTLQNNSPPIQENKRKGIEAATAIQHDIMSRTSWIGPFTLGAAVSLSLAWVSGRLIVRNETPARKTTTAVTPRNPRRLTLPTNSGRFSTPSEQQFKEEAKEATKSILPPTPRTSNIRPPKPERTVLLPHDDDVGHNENDNDDDGGAASAGASTDVVLMDSMDLDQRLLRKAEAVIQWRTSRLVLVVERCTNDHNYSAILRTTEALGIQTVYMIDPPPPAMYDPTTTGSTTTGMTMINEDDSLLTQQEKRKLKLSTPEEIEARREHHLFAKKATEWLTVKDFTTSEECVSELRSLGYELWVTDLSQQAECLTLTSPRIPERVAIVMGTEAVGCSQYMLDEADKRIYLPLRGYADSLNLSVATALVLHQIFIMDPTLIGAMSEEERLVLRKAWYGKLCQQRLLTPKQRKARTKLQLMIKKCHTIQERSQTRALQPSERDKLNELPSYERQLEELESTFLDSESVQDAISEWVTNPPTPLTDVRRADEHRVCFVGKNTRNIHKDHWKDMAATANVPSLYMSSARDFRERMSQLQQVQHHPQQDEEHSTGTTTAIPTNGA